MNENDNDQKPSAPIDENIETLSTETVAEVAATPAPAAESFGKWMLEQRTLKGMTLEEIASVTKIQLSMLKCIEADDYSKLPAPAFIRGFIVNFARFIGADEQIAVEKFRSQLKKSDNINSLSAYLGQNTSAMASSVATASTVDIPRRELTQSGLTKNYNRPSAAMDMDATPIFTPKRALIGLGVVLVIVITAVLFNIGSKQNDAGETATETAAAIAETENSESPLNDPDLDLAPAELATTATPTPAPVAPPPPAPVVEAVKEVAPAFTYHLKLRGIDSSWINVRVDQKGSQGNMLEKGQSKDFYGNQRIVVALSDAGGVEIIWNGKAYQPAGFRGDVKSLNLPDDLSKLKER